VARTLPAVELLRRVWIAEYQIVEGQVQQRTPDDMPPASEHIDAPYDPEARYSAKRSMEWIGYKAHLTETCDDDTPHLLTHVETTVAQGPDAAAAGRT
jgi:transposase